MRPPRSHIPFDELRQACEKLYLRDGFVKWAEIADAYGITRQAVHARLKAAIERGDLDNATFDRWRSVSSRRAQSKVNERLREEVRKLTFAVTLTPDNFAWLRTECLARRATSSDLINGLLNKARASS